MTITIFLLQATLYIYIAKEVPGRVVEIIDRSVGKPFKFVNDFGQDLPDLGQDLGPDFAPQDEPAPPPENIAPPYLEPQNEPSPRHYMDMLNSHEYLQNQIIFYGGASANVPLSEEITSLPQNNPQPEVTQAADRYVISSFINQRKIFGTRQASNFTIYIFRKRRNNDPGILTGKY